MKLAQIPGRVAQLQEQLAGARINKIHQPAANLLILRLRAAQQNLRLMINVAPQENYLGLTEQSFPNPFTPPRFCQLLRARVTQILSVQQLNADRIIDFACRGPKGECRLIVELTGKSSNIILIDEIGTIIDALKRQPGGRIVPKANYQLPAKVDLKTEENDSKAKEQPPGENTVGLIYTAQDAENISGLRTKLEKLISREQKKLTRRSKNIREEQQRQENFTHYRQQGELLLANRHLLHKGMAEVEVANYYRQPPESETILLNPKLGPQENIEKYFKKYKKARRGVEHSARRLKETEQEQLWLAQLAYQLEASPEPAEIALVAEELKTAGMLKGKDTHLPRVQKSARLFKERLSPSGFKVLWGNNSRQNDALSTKILKRGDVWFHAQNCPGSHVVLKADSALGPFAEADLAFAASVAAAHSKAANDTKVEVMQADSKAVKKPRGAKPGMVAVTNYTTLVVEPLVEKDDDF